MRVAIVVASIAWFAGLARAEPDAEWRDGCPAGAIVHPPYGGTRPRQTGAAPQLDSALVATRVVVSPLNLGHFLANNTSQHQARLEFGFVQAHVNLPFSSDDTAQHNVAVTVTSGYGWQLAGDSADAPRQFGNIVVGAAYRYSWLTAVERSAEPAPLVAGLRGALAVQVFAAATAPSNEHDATTLESHDPFQGSLFAAHHPIGVAFELRGEAVGCYAPFVHLRLSAFGHDSGTGQARIFAPQTLALGIYMSSNVAFMAQYGFLFYFDPSSRDRLLDADVVHRFRLAIERSSERWVVGGNLDLYVGSAMFDGTMFGIYAGLNWDAGGRL